MLESTRQTVLTLLDNQWWRVLAILLGSLLVVILLRVLLMPILRRLTRKTAIEVDDQIADRLWPALFQTVFLQAIHWAVIDFVPDTQIDLLVTGIVTTLMVLIWGRFALNAGAIIFKHMSEQADRVRWVQPQTLPLIQFTFKVLVVAIMGYLIMSAWEINLTSWLASAGVVGIAVGFAAKDTLANFISGVFILVDAPYNVGQYIVIDGVTRGVVTDIGMRSTRLLTRDNVEVTVPNAVIGNAKIVNESSGPSPRMRVRVSASVAYGSNVDRVREILLSCTEGLSHVSDDQKPSIRFRAMGESSLDFQAMVWVKHPVFRGRVTDELNTRIYKALMAEGVEIPFPQRDIHIKEWPAPPAGLGTTAPVREPGTDSAASADELEL